MKDLVGLLGLSFLSSVCGALCFDVVVPCVFGSSIYLHYPSGKLLWYMGGLIRIHCSC